MNKVAFNAQTAGVNYLGMNPTLQTKSNNFNTYKANNPLYFVWEGMDYDLPNNSVNNNPNIAPRYIPSTYTISNNFSAGEIKNYKTQLNKYGAQQIEFKHNELFGYSEHLK